MFGNNSSCIMDFRKTDVLKSIKETLQGVLLTGSHAFSIWVSGQGGMHVLILIEMY